MSRTARWGLAVIALQAALIGVYWLVEQQRTREPGAPRVLGTEPPRRVDLPMPRVAARRRDGATVEIPSSARPTLVHIWATWCPPCRAELPGLLALPAEHAVDVVAIALDKDWADVERFLGGLGGEDVLLADGDEVERALGVSNLPVTFLVHDQTRVALRFDGARDWTDEAFVKAHLAGAGDER